MKAIKTKYLVPTDTRGSRIKATDEDGNSITIPWAHEMDSLKNHREAARCLIEKMHWPWRSFCSGALKDSYVHVASHAYGHDQQTGV